MLKKVGKYCELPLEFQLNVANNEVPTKLSLAVTKAEANSTQIANLKNRSETLKLKVEDFLQRTEPLRNELEKRFTAINKLEHVLIYLKSFEKIDEIRQVPILYQYFFPHIIFQFQAVVSP